MTMMGKKKLAIFISAVILLSVLAVLLFRASSLPLATSEEQSNTTFSHDLALNANAKDADIFNQFSYKFTFERAGFINSSLFTHKLKDKHDSEKIAINSRLSGLLNIQFIQKEHSKSLYFARLSQVDNAHYISDSDLNDLLEPFSFYLNANGALELNEDQINYNDNLKDFVSFTLPYLQLVGLSDSYDTWTTRELDPVGRYKANYKIDKSDAKLSIVKHKLSYDQLNPLPALFGTPKTNTFAEIVHHSTAIKIKAESMWPTETVLSERVVLKSGDVVISDMPTKFSAFISAFDPNVVIPNTLAALSNSLSSKVKDVSYYYQTDDTLSALVAGKNMDEVFQIYYELTESDKFLAKDVIINYLRLHPELSIAFVDKIYTERDNLSDIEEVRLWHALAKAGHHEAQNAYIYALENPEFKQIIQYRAIGHIRVFEQPSREFVEKLWSIQQKISNSDIGSASDRKALAKGVLFAIATLSSNEQIDSNLKEEITQTLKDKLYLANNETEKINLTIAAGNTKNPALLNDVSPSLNSENIELRSKAFKAISNMPHDSVIDTYINAYERIEETDRQMQFQALKSLNRMDLTESTVEWVADRALQLNNKTEVKKLIQILGNNLSNSPVAEITLRKLLATDIPIQLKSDIYAFIPPAS